MTDLNNHPAGCEVGVLTDPEYGDFHPLGLTLGELSNLIASVRDGLETALPVLKQAMVNPAINKTLADLALTKVNRALRETPTPRGELPKGIDPTAFTDIVADEMRRYYEANRPRGWLARRRERAMRELTTDDLMLGLLGVARRAYRDPERFLVDIVRREEAL